MKNYAIYLLLALLFSACIDKNKDGVILNSEEKISTPTILPTKELVVPSFTITEANKLIALPLHCVEVEYPNKLGQTIANVSDLKPPQELHPTFYGCFDWHSAVHGYWSMVTLLKSFPDLEEAEKVRQLLKGNITAENIAQEVLYFEGKYSKSFERTYGWAWLLKLAETLNTWDDPMAQELAVILQPLTDVIVVKYLEFLPKLVYPIRVGEHTNTAFGLAFAYDYGISAGHLELKTLIEIRAMDFYANDSQCPIEWEPSGYDFLSPCLEEIDIMRRILDPISFKEWLHNFMPQLAKDDFSLAVGQVKDRTDGKLVHLDGLNFSRAWVLYGLANQYPEFGHLKRVANSHIAYSYPNLVGDSYEGGHWLGSFAIYALETFTDK